MINIVERECLLEAVLNSCEDMVTVKDLDFRYLAYNDSLLRMLGRSDSVIGKSIYEVLSPETSGIISKNLNEVISTLETRSCVLRVQNERLDKIIRQTSSPIIKDGVLRGILTISSDVTHEENLRTKLIEKNYQLHTLLESLPVLVYMKDKDRNLSVSTKSSKEFVTNGIDKFAKNIQINMELAKAETAKEDNYVLENKKLLIKEKAAQDYDGKQHWYRVYKAPILTETNDANGLVTIAVNINKEKEAENQKNLFLATLTHDLKNPLQAQISSLELFYQGVFGALTDVQKEMLEMIIESSKYMRTMLCSLMKTCKENNGIISLEKKYFDIVNLVKGCVREVTDLGVSKNIEIKFVSKLQEQDRIFYADEIQLRRVIGNLLNNGLNYAYSNSELKIELLKKEDKLYMIFENDSEPIRQELVDCIFDKYVCANPLHSNINAGLGLYFCKQVVDAHGGNITLKTKGHRNRFMIELPVLDETTSFMSEIVL